MNKSQNEQEWSSDYQQMLLHETKEMLHEALNCGQMPQVEKLVLMAMSRLGFDQIYCRPSPIVLEWLNIVANQKYMDSLLLVEGLEEIIFHNHTDIQFYINGRSSYFERIELKEDDYTLSLKILCHHYGISWNFSEPFASFSIQKNGSNYRATLIHAAINQRPMHKLFLRKITSNCYPLESYCGDQKVASWMLNAVNERSNILIAGATGSGKTALLSSLLSDVPNEQHIIALEDTDELVCDSQGFTKLLSNGQKNKSLSDYMTYAMRMRPDRIILGEMRSHEVIPFILASNTGHKGLMATIHANSAKEAIERVATLFAIYNQSIDIAHQHILKMISRNIDYVIYVEEKKVKEIIRPLGNEGDHLLYSEEYRSPSK